MKMYIWGSDATASLCCGYLIAVADNAEEAKDKIRNAFSSFMTSYHGGCGSKSLEKLESDLAYAPTIDDVLITEETDH